MRMFFNVKSQGTKNIKFFSQGTDDSKNLYIADHKYVNISSFDVLEDIKLWLEEDSDLHTNHPLHTFKSG